MTYDARSPLPDAPRPARPTGLDGLAQLRPAVAVALGLLQQKIHAVDYRDPTGVTMQPLWPQIPPSQRIAIEREARRLAGYRQG